MRISEIRTVPLSGPSRSLAGVSSPLT